MYEIRTEDLYKVFRNNREIFDFSNYLTKSKYYDNSKKIMVGKMKDETAGVAIEKFVRLKPKMYSYLVDDNSENKKVKSANKNVVSTTSHNKYKDTLLNKKCLRHEWMNRTMNRIQSKDQRIGTYESTRLIKYISNTLNVMNY